MYIKSLKELGIQKEDVGENAFLLNKIWKYGVPEGFVVTRQTYDSFIKNIKSKIELHLMDTNIEEASQKIQHIIETTDFSKEAAQQIENAYLSMNCTYKVSEKLKAFDFLKHGESADVAVRASPTFNLNIN